MKKLSLKAKCLCGNISFKTSGYHRDVQNCHCVQCLKTHGHHAAYSKVEEKDLKFLSKKSLKWFKSSKRAKRGFCSNCGASIFFKVIGTNSVCIAAGIFNNPTKLKTSIEIFTKGKSDYYKINSKLPKYARYPKG
ncbi:GFA family protein [Candidatus Pelagibacter sp.]|uniref:GFA family protein n=1 Tax=Candidatus Pelagibacter sp. TaxID=2024849 RepID=UPI003F85F47E